MTTPDTGSAPGNEPQTTDRPWYKKKRFMIPIAILVVAAVINMFTEDSDDTTAQDSPRTSEVQAVETTEDVVEDTPEAEETEAPEEEAPAEPEGPDIDRSKAPQEWFNDVYREKRCGAQSIEFGGEIMCDVEGVDTEDDGRTLMIFMPNTDPVKDHFDNEARRDAFAVSMAAQVGQAQHDGEERVHYVEDVHIIADGGWTGSWDREQNISDLGF